MSRYSFDFKQPKDSRSSDISELWEIEDVHISKKLEIFEHHPAKNFSKSEGGIIMKNINNSFKIDQLNIPSIDLTVNLKNIASKSQPSQKNMMDPSSKTPITMNDPSLSSKNKKREISITAEIAQKEIPLTNSKLLLVKKFINKLRENTIYATKKLKGPIFERINDLGFFPSSNLHLTEKTIFVPSNKMMFFWECWTIIVTVYNFAVIPLEIAFEKENLGKIYDFRYFSMGIFLIDFIKNLNCAFYNKGELIISRRSVIENYLTKGTLFFDLISSLCLISDYSSPFLKFIAILFLLRLKNFSNFLTKLEESAYGFEINESIISLIRLFFLLILLSHWTACFYILIGKSEKFEGWMDINLVKNSDILTQYVSSLYFIVSIMNNVGLGNIIAQTVIEKIFITCFLMLSSIVFASTLFRIGLIFWNFEESDKEFKKIMKTINGDIIFMNTPDELKLRIRNYLQYIWSSEKNQKGKEVHIILNKLSKTLKDELIFNANQDALKRVPTFMNNFSKKSLNKIIKEMKEVHFRPNDFIYHQNEIDLLNLYIVKTGEVGIFLESQKGEQNDPVLLKVLKQNEHFGEISFFTGFPRSTFAKSLSFTSLFVINKEVFMRVLKENTKDYETFCSIKDKINLSNKLDELKRQCFSCGNDTHFEYFCPKLHPIFNKKKVIQKYISNPSFFQNRKFFQRQTNRKKFKTLKNLALLKNHAEIISKIPSKRPKSQESMESENEDKNQDDTLTMIKMLLRPEIPLKPEDHNEFQKDASHLVEEFIPGSISHKERKSKKKDLDLVKSFENYFPAGNIEELISKVNCFNLRNKLSNRKEGINFLPNVLHSEKNLKSLDSYVKIKRLPKTKASLFANKGKNQENKETIGFKKKKNYKNLKALEHLKYSFTFLKTNCNYLLQFFSEKIQKIKKFCRNSD